MRLELPMIPNWRKTIEQKKIYESLIQIHGSFKQIYIYMDHLHKNLKIFRSSNPRIKSNQKDNIAKIKLGLSYKCEVGF